MFVLTNDDVPVPYKSRDHVPCLEYSDTERMRQEYCRMAALDVVAERALLCHIQLCRYFGSIIRIVEAFCCKHINRCSEPRPAYYVTWR